MHQKRLHVQCAIQTMPFAMQYIVVITICKVSGHDAYILCTRQEATQIQNQYC